MWRENEISIAKWVKLEIRLILFIYLYSHIFITTKICKFDYKTDDFLWDIKYISAFIYYRKKRKPVT